MKLNKIKIQESLVSIILLNYNGIKYNKDCIASILRQSYENFEIVFVDNNSTDGSLDEVLLLFKKEINNGKIIIIKNNKNDGFDGGNNLGVCHISKQSKYIWLLNNDTILKENTLEELVKGIESNNKVGAVSSIVTNKLRGKIKYVNFPTFFGGLKTIEIESDELINVSCLAGCSLLYRKSIIDKPFEDYYFAYSEEPYLCRRILSKGYSLGFCPKSIICHFGGGSSKKMSDFCLFHKIKNRLINWYVFLSRYNLVFFSPLILIRLIILFISSFFSINVFKSIIIRKNVFSYLCKNFGVIKKTKSDIVNELNIKQKDFLNNMTFDYGLYSKGWFGKFLSVLLDSLFKCYSMIVKFINTLIY